MADDMGQLQIVDRMLTMQADRDRYKALWEELLEAIPDGALIVDQDGRIFRANRQARRFFGYDVLQGMRVDDLVPEGVRDKHANYRSRYRLAPRARPMAEGVDLNGRKKDGAAFPVSIQLWPFRIPDGDMTIALVRERVDA